MSTDKHVKPVKYESLFYTPAILSLYVAKASSKGCLTVISPGTLWLCMNMKLKSSFYRTSKKEPLRIFKGSIEKIRSNSAAIKKRVLSPGTNCHVIDSSKKIKKVTIQK